MKGMENLSDAILSKVRAEAQNIIEDVEAKAREEIAKAEKQREAKLDEEKRRMTEKAEREAVRILAEASVRARHGLLKAKTSIIDEIANGVKDVLSGISGDESSLLNLIREAVSGLGAGKVTVYVSPKDVSAARAMVGADEELTSKITEIRQCDCLGGVIAEDVDAKVRLDNTYETRLETLLPRLLPELTRELFQNQGDFKKV